METIKQTIVNSSGAQVGSVDLDARVFSVQVNQHVVFEAVQAHLSARRSGTHSCLTKGEMQGGGKKPWRQKGTGRARAGSSTSPIWVGGGVAHGPKVRSYSSRASKRLKMQAMLAVLSDKAAAGALVVVDALGGGDEPLKSGKTKNFATSLKKLGLDNKRVGFLVPTEGAELILRTVRNIPSVEPLFLEHLSAYELLRCDAILCSVESLKHMQASLGERLEKLG